MRSVQINWHLWNDLAKFLFQRITIPDVVTKLFQILSPMTQKTFNGIRKNYTFFINKFPKPFKNYTLPCNCSSLMLLLLWDPTPVVVPELWLAETTSRREELEAVNLRFRDSLLRAESAFLQASPAPGNTHRLWLFNRPRDGWLFRGDSCWVTSERVKKKYR